MHGYGGKSSWFAAGRVRAASSLPVALATGSYWSSRKRAPTPLPLLVGIIDFLLGSGWRKPPFFWSKRLFNPSLDDLSCVLSTFCSNGSYLVIHRRGELPSADFDALSNVIFHSAIFHFLLFLLGPLGCGRLITPRQIAQPHSNAFKSKAGTTLI